MHSTLRPDAWKGLQSSLPGCFSRLPGCQQYLSVSLVPTLPEHQSCHWHLSPGPVQHNSSSISTVAVATNTDLALHGHQADVILTYGNRHDGVPMRCSDSPTVSKVISVPEVQVSRAEGTKHPPCGL